MSLPAGSRTHLSQRPRLLKGTWVWPRLCCPSADAGRVTYLECLEPKAQGPRQLMVWLAGSAESEELTGRLGASMLFLGVYQLYRRCRTLN